MIPRNTLSPGLYLSIHRRRPDRHYLSKLIPRHCTTRHILRRCPLPLCFINRSRLCHHRRLHPLIPFIFRLYIKPNLRQSPLHRYIRRCKPNLFSTTLPRLIWNTPTLLRLPRCLYHMKHPVICGLLYFTNSNNSNNLYNLRSFRLKT